MRLDIKNLTIKFDDQIIYENANLNIEFDSLQIVGKNGSGKSTLLNAIYKNIKYDGIISLDSKDIKEVSKNNLREDISYIRQIPELFNNLTPYKNAYLFKIDVNKFEKFIKYFNKEEILHKKINVLSGGEKQLINLGLGFSKNSKILLIDEPLNNISKINKNKIIDIIQKDLRPKIIITHKDIEINSKKVSLKSREFYYE